MARHAILMAALLVAPLAACTSPGTPVARTAAPAHADCLDPARARSFEVLDDDVLLVDAGLDHYKLQLDPACIGIDFEVALHLRGDPVMNRVCGYGRDAILTDRGDCRIDRVEWISRDAYQALQHPKPAASH